MPPISSPATRTAARTSSSATERHEDRAGERGQRRGSGERRRAHPAISADGRYVAFGPVASNLVGGDTNGNRDVFVRDRQAGTTELISASGAGGAVRDTASEYPSISADGRYLAFETRVNGIPGGSCLVVQDRQTGYTRWVMGAGGEPFSISADGRCVALKAWADYLAPGNDHQVFGIFVVVDPLGPPTYVSLRGTDRYDTAIKVSRAGPPEARCPAGSGLVLAPGRDLPGGALRRASGGGLRRPGASHHRPRVWTAAVLAEILRLEARSTWSASGSPTRSENAVQAALGGTGAASAIQRHRACTT